MIEPNRDRKPVPGSRRPADRPRAPSASFPLLSLACTLAAPAAWSAARRTAEMSEDSLQTLVAAGAGESPALDAARHRWPPATTRSTWPRAISTRPSSCRAASGKAILQVGGIWLTQGRVKSQPSLPHAQPGPSRLLPAGNPPGRAREGEAALGAAHRAPAHVLPHRRSYLPLGRKTAILAFKQGDSRPVPLHPFQVAGPARLRGRPQFPAGQLLPGRHAGPQGPRRAREAVSRMARSSCWPRSTMP